MSSPEPHATSWRDRVPKVELHVHLEGAIPHDALWRIVAKYGGSAEAPDIAALRKLFAYRDFRHFLDIWTWKNGFLREYEDFTFFSEAVARTMAAQNIRYAEVFFSPSDFASHGLAPQGMAQAIRAGLDKVPEIRVLLVADLVRGPDLGRMARTLAEVAEVRSCGIVGITIGGDERAFPPEPFAGLYQEARRLGFRTSAHAGEAAGAGSVWGAVRTLQVDRIGHGTRAREDDALLDHLARRAITLEMCPVSNLRTGVVQSPGDLPIRQYLERGIPVTINNDDPAMFGTSLAEEYRLLETELGFSRREIQDMILQAARSSWLPHDEKRALEESLISDPDWD
ncbi:MAG: adenosine deaminase [Spirochaetia bacterium]|jgi:adenosine deaminase